jgi:hypothetical protein
MPILMPKLPVNAQGIKAFSVFPSRSLCPSRLWNVRRTTRSEIQPVCKNLYENDDISAGVRRSIELIQRTQYPLQRRKFVPREFRVLNLN